MLNLKKHYFILLISSLLCSSIESNAQLFDLILNKPEKALDLIQEIHAKFKKQLREQEILALSKTDMDKALDELEKLREKFALECPLFLLNECTKEDVWYCLLSRKFEPKFRKTFEKKACEITLNKINTSIQPIQYVAFGCGGLFQDMVILSKVLNKKPNAHIVIHLIEFEHTPYVRIRDFLNNTREVTADCITSINPIIEHVIHYARQHWGDLESMNDKEIGDTLKAIISNKEARFRQFIKWLNVMFPVANVSLFIHDKADSYLMYIKQNQVPYPDVIIAADIDDEMSLLKQSATDLHKLIVETLKHNIIAQALVLRKGAMDSLHVTAVISRYLANHDSCQTKQDTPFVAKIEEISASLFTLLKHQLNFLVDCFTK